MSLRDLRRHAGRLAIVGFSGTSVPEDLRRLAAEFDVGGVIYFARNIDEPRQVLELSREAAGLARDWPLWIGVDQEGGRVARLKRPFTEWPPMATLGRSSDAGLAGRFASALAQELSAVGITLDFAPVLDIQTNPKNTAIGDRALATEAAAVARLGQTIVRGLQTQGITACGKHFPGHGDTVADSHDELPVADHARRDLDAREFVPFRAAIAEQVAMIMTAHVLVPAIDARNPATLSRTIVTEILKHDLQFDGVVASDDLGMKGVSATRTLPELMVESIHAGCDVALLCNSTAHEQASAIEAVIRAAESGHLAPSRIDDALKRQHRAKAAFESFARKSIRPPLDVVGCDAHQAIAREMAAWM